MNDIAKRFPENPILYPKDIKPSNESLEIACLLNPGVFRFNNKIWLIIRVAERPITENENYVTFPYFSSEGETEFLKIATTNPKLDLSDSRILTYDGEKYLTTLSHFRVMCSDDGKNFYEPKDYKTIIAGEGEYESYGIEDCRVTEIENEFYLTYTSVSEKGVAVGMRTTKDWKNFESHGIILPPHNKDCTLFTEKINGLYYALHRPSGIDLGGNYVWMASSPDGKHWGNHQCILKTRKNLWDSARVGAGAAPIKTEKGWLEIYHGANENHQYCLGAFLMDLENPYKVIARTEEPIMQPIMEYEKTGFFGNVVFTNGHVIQPDNDTVTIYYGASDEVVCGAEFSIKKIISHLKFSHDR